MIKRTYTKSILLIKEAFFASVFCIFCSLILSLIVFNLSFLNPVKEALKDFSFLDVYYAEKFNAKNKINQNIILVNIENKSRFELSMLLEKIQRAKPKAILLDVIFKEIKEKESDSLLANQLVKNNIIGSYNIINKNTFIKNHSKFKIKDSGFVNFNFNNSKVIRSFNGIYNHKKSLAVTAIEKFEFEKWEKFKYAKKLKTSHNIKYFGNLSSFTHFGFDEFMQLTNTSIIANKYVLIGYLGNPTGNKHDITDKFFTPLNSNTSGKSNADMFGIVIHANILNMLLHNNFMYKISNFWVYVLSFLSVFMVFVLLIWLYEKGSVIYQTFRALFLFFYSLFWFFITLFLFKNNIVLKSVPIFGLTVVSSGFLVYYIQLVKYLKIKRKWKSYLS